MQRRVGGVKNFYKFLGDGPFWVVLGHCKVLMLCVRVRDMVTAGRPISLVPGSSIAANVMLAAKREGVTLRALSEHLNVSYPTFRAMLQERATPSGKLPDRYMVALRSALDYLSGNSNPSVYMPNMYIQGEIDDDTKALAGFMLALSGAYWLHDIRALVDTLYDGLSEPDPAMRRMLENLYMRGKRSDIRLPRSTVQDIQNTISVRGALDTICALLSMSNGAAAASKMGIDLERYTDSLEPRYKAMRELQAMAEMTSGMTDAFIQFCDHWGIDELELRRALLASRGNVARSTAYRATRDIFPDGAKLLHSDTIESFVTALYHVIRLNSWYLPPRSKGMDENNTIRVRDTFIRFALTMLPLCGSVLLDLYGKVEGFFFMQPVEYFDNRAQARDGEIVRCWAAMRDHAFPKERGCNTVWYDAGHAVWDLPAVMQEFADKAEAETLQQMELQERLSRLTPSPEN